MRVFFTLIALSAIGFGCMWGIWAWTIPHITILGQMKAILWAEGFVVLGSWLLWKTEH